MPDSNDLLVFISAFAPGDDGAIHAFAFSADSGELRDLKCATPIDTPFFMALSHDRRFLYSIDDFAKGGVTAFELTDKQGGLRRLNTQSTGGAGACYVDIDATGKTVVVANYTGGSVAALAVQQDGSLEASHCVIKQQGSSIDTGRQEAPHAHSIVVGPGNRFAYLPDLGLDQILNFRLNAVDASLTPNRQPFVRTVPGGGPRHFTFHPHLATAYCINEMHNSVTRFDCDRESGALFERDTVPTLPDDFTGVSHTADLKITPGGRFLYGTNRGHDSIACFAIDDDGTLSRIAIEASGGGGPQNLAVTPDGNWLICANMAGHSVTVFAIDTATGCLTKQGGAHAMPGPSCVMIV